MVVVALLSVDLVESVDLVSVYLVVNCISLRFLWNFPGFSYRSFLVSIERWHKRHYFSAEPKTMSWFWRRFLAPKNNPRLLKVKLFNVEAGYNYIQFMEELASYCGGNPSKYEGIPSTIEYKTRGSLIFLGQNPYVVGLISTSRLLIFLVIFFKWGLL